jgi:hypothetical protein
MEEEKFAVRSVIDDGTSTAIWSADFEPLPDDPETIEW